MHCKLWYFCLLYITAGQGSSGNKNGDKPAFVSIIHTQATSKSLEILASHDLGSIFGVHVALCFAHPISYVKRTAWHTRTESFRLRILLRAWKVAYQKVTLVFNNLRDSAHRAAFNTVATSDAGLFVNNGNNTIDNFKYFLGANRQHKCRSQYILLLE